MKLLYLTFQEDAPLYLGAVSYTHLDVYKRQMESFASYAFNKSHATAYALLAYPKRW